MADPPEEPTGTGTVNSTSTRESLHEPLLPPEDHDTVGSDSALGPGLWTSPPASDTSSSLSRRQTQATPSPSSSRMTDRNIPVMLWYQGFRCGAESIWTGNVLAAYVYLLKPKNPEMIGYLSAIEGIIQFFAACGAGVLADYHRHHNHNHESINDDYDNGTEQQQQQHLTSYDNTTNVLRRPFYSRRDVLLRFATISGLTASTLVMVSCRIDTTAQTVAIICLAVALGLNGAFDGIALTVSLALFADTIKDGDRSYYFTQRTLCTTLGQMIGPLVAVTMFYELGDHWTIQACGIVMQTAQVLLLPAFALLWCFHEVTDGHGVMTVDVDDEVETHPLVSHNDDLATDGMIESNHDDPIDRRRTQTRPEHQYHRSVAAGAAASDVVCAIASGISLRYFTIFFLDNLVLGPVIVNLLDALSRVIGSILLVVAQRASVRVGRCTVSISFKIVGSICLLSMIGVYWWNTNQQSDGLHHNELWWSLGDGDSNSSSSTPPPPSIAMKGIVCFLYLLQMAFLNSTGALTRSLVMDNVPSHDRAKWSALESINIFGWCGSAAIGGVLVSWLGSVLPVFGVSAALQVFGILPLLSIVLCGKEQLE